MLLSALLALVKPDERGDPMSPLRCLTTTEDHAVAAKHHAQGLDPDVAWASR